MSTASGMLEGWAPWHPKYGFVGEFSETTWFSTDLDDIAHRVIDMNRDDGTNNRNGWRAVRVRVMRVE